MNKKFLKIVFGIVVVVLVGTVGYFVFINKESPPKAPPTITSTPTSSLPTTCKDESEGAPVITSLSTDYGPVGTSIEIKGCNFSGFEGDKNAWIENSQGIKGPIYGEVGSTNKLLKIILKSPICQKDNSYSGLPCDAWLTLAPGTYKIYTEPWGKKSYEAIFSITP
jgi:hypothetical protein